MSLPQTRFDRLEYLENRTDTWGENQAAIGISLEQSADVDAKTASARTAYDLYLEAKIALDDARTSWYNAIAQATTSGRSCLRSINTFAKNSADPDAVYALASVAPPKQREPLGPPAAPGELRVELDTEGRANLMWSGTRQGGTVFTLQRRTTSTTGQTGPWTTIATVPERSYIDPTTPSGVASVGYRVRGERVGGVSAFSLPVTLPLGAGGNQQEIAGAIAPVEASGKEAG